MRVLIIEDEYHATQYLRKLLHQTVPDLQVLDQLDSVADSVAWLRDNPPPELIFMDIQLADGLSFDIFQQVEVAAPVIFTTAFDQYTLRAFKINSIDYLLKPVEAEELEAALQKFQRYHSATAPPTNELARLLSELHLRQEQAYRQRFLIKQGKQFSYLLVRDLAHLYSEDGLTFAIDQKGRRLVLDSTLESISEELDPAEFFRINRAQIVRLQAIGQIHSWFNHRLKLDLQPNPTQLESVVSRDRVKSFKAWLDR